MSGPDERPEEARQGWNSRGASIEMRHDPRMSKILAWFYGALGMAFVTGSWIAANNLYSINLQLAADSSAKEEIIRQLAQMQARIDKNDEQDDRQDEHINFVDRRVSTIEGRNLRGGPEVRRER